VGLCGTGPEQAWGGGDAVSGFNGGAQPLLCLGGGRVSPPLLHGLRNQELAGEQSCDPVHGCTALAIMCAHALWTFAAAVGA
jgi:hypothetical protein